MSDSFNELLELNSDGLRAFVEGDIEHFKKLDKSVYNLILEFRQNFIEPIAEISSKGKFVCFKPGVTEQQIVFITKHARKILTKIIELKEVNDKLINDFLESNEREKEHQKLYTEIDNLFDSPDILDNKDRLNLHFQSELGKEFAEKYIKNINSKSFKRYLETGSEEDYNSHVNECFPDLVEHYKKYDLGPVKYDIPEEEQL